MEANFKNKLNTLKTIWTQYGVKINSGIFKIQIDDFQNEFKFEFEDDFITYLTDINGFVDFDSDEAWFCFWDLNRMKIDNSDNSLPEDVMWFADHSINLCVFGFHKADKKIYTNFQHRDEIIFVANDFNEFISIYIDNPYNLIM